MKARYIQEARAVNPAFSNKAKREAAAKGETYDVSPYMQIPVGFEEEGPLCWTHCVPGHMNAPPVCEPADDECKERVRKWMEEQRPLELERIRQMAQPENLKRLNKNTRGYVEELAEAYGLIGQQEPVVPVTPTPNASEGEDNDEVPESGDG